MTKRIALSFRSNEFDERLFKHLEESSRYIGMSGYMRELLRKDMLRKSAKKSIPDK
jgi:hypothetical protein